METKEIFFQSASNKLFGKLILVDKEKPTVILLHGLGFHSFEYDDFAPLLANAGYNTLAFDFRSCGKSEGRRGYWKISDYVEDTKNAIEYVKSNINGQIFLYGNSLGADVAIMLCAESDSAGIRGIISANCATRPRDFILSFSRKIILAVATPVSKIIPFRLSVNYFIPYALILSDKEIISKIAADEKVTDARKFAVSTYRDILSWDMTKFVSNVKVPILIMQGKKDRLQPVSQAQKLFDVANQPKELIYLETGHLPNLENPKYLSDIVIDWLNKNK